MVKSFIHLERFSQSGQSHVEFIGNKLLQFLGGLKNSYFFLSIFIFQVLLTFQGLDLADEGFLANFYHGIFDDPNSMSYNFMFWLTGIIGGAWLKVFGFLGLWGLRMAGAIVITLTAFVTFDLLKNYLRQDILKLALICVMLFHNHDIKIINYNTLSALVFVLIASTLLNGLFKNRLGLFFLAGFLVCANTFIRFPNILQIGLILIIPYYNWLKGKSFRMTINQAFFFAVGFIACLAISLLTMRILGHWDAYQKALQYISNMGSSSSTEKTGGEYYGMLNVVKLFIQNNLRAVKFAVIALVFSVLLQLGMSYFESKFSRFGKTFWAVFQSAIVFALMAVIVLNVDRLMLLVMFCGIPILAFVLDFFSTRKSDRFFVYLVGMFFLLSYPVGSLLGIYTAGRFCSWIAMPFSFAFFLKLSTIKLDLIYRKDTKFSEHRTSLTENILRGSFWLTLLFIIVAGFYNQYRYPFYDWHSRLDMRYTLKNDKFRMIYTTEDRVQQTDELFENVSKYSKANDYIIAYDRIPMLFYATDTRSYLSNPFPGTYGTDLFKNDLNEALDRRGFLPLIVRQKIHTIGLGSKWPTEIVEDKMIKLDEIGKDAILDSFLVKHAYTEVWSNQCFRILKPAASVGKIQTVSAR
jgi:hypothetical protein